MSRISSELLIWILCPQTSLTHPLRTVSRYLPSYKKKHQLGDRFGGVWDGLRGRESIPGCPGGVFERFSYFPRGFPEFSNLTHGDLSITTGLSHQAISKDRSHCCMNDEKFENLQKRCETYGDSQETIKNKNI